MKSSLFDNKLLFICTSPAIRGIFFKQHTCHLMRKSYNCISLVANVNNEGLFTWEQLIFSALSRVPFGDFF